MKRMLPIPLVFIMACSSFNTGDRWEGIRENRLRIYVRVTPDDVGEKDEKTVTADLAKARARHVLFSYVSRRLGQKSLFVADRIDGLVAEALKQGKTVFREEGDDEYTAVYIEYDISSLLKEVHRIEEAEKPKPEETGTGGNP